MGLRGFAFFILALAGLLLLAGIYAFFHWPGRAFWLFWIAAAFLGLWGRNCLLAQNSDEHDDSLLIALIRASRW